MSESPERRGNPALPVILGLGALALLAVIVVVAVIASGSGDDKPEQTPAVLEGSEVTIDIRDFDYSPRDATISAGTTVTWVNSDSAPHDAVASNDDDPWEIDILDEGDSGSVTFGNSGNFEYHCSIHPDMEGQLTVVD